MDKTTNTKPTQQTIRKVKPWMMLRRKNKKTNKKLKNNKTHKKSNTNSKPQKNKEDTEDNFDKEKYKNHNKTQHCLNGNRSHIKFLQLNGSNADFQTKIMEL